MTTLGEYVDGWDRNGDPEGAVYLERNALVLVFATLAKARGWTVGVLDDAEAPGWPVVVIDSPFGQMSWHLPLDEVRRCELAPYPGEWDGHTTREKYDRIERLIAP